MKELERPFVFSSTDGIAGSKPGDFTMKPIPNLILDKKKNIILRLINLMVIIRGITSIQHTIIIKLAILMMLEKPTL